MKKLGKSRKGFTLVEMVLAIAIIVILASVIVLGVGQYLDKAKAAASSGKIHNDSVSYVSSIVGVELGENGNSDDSDA